MSVRINGLPMPARFLDALASGDWPPAPSKELAEQVFGERAENPFFYPLDGIEGVNRSWLDETRAVYLGTKDGLLDPSTAVLIGELGPDALVALRFAGPEDPRPSVIYLKGTKAKWVEVVPDIGALLDALSEDSSPGTAGFG